MEWLVYFGFGFEMGSFSCSEAKEKIIRMIKEGVFFGEMHRNTSCVDLW